MNLPPDYADGAYDELSFWAARFGAFLFDHLEIRRNIRGLDVACGAGFPLIELADVHGSSSYFIGLDIWPEALERARRKMKILGITNAEVREGDAAAMPFDDASFDLITSNLGINNFADVPAALRELYRVAKPGARIALTTNLTGHMAELYDAFRAVAPELRHAINAQEAHRGTKDSIVATIDDSGLRVTKAIESEFTIPFADGAALMRHRLVQFFKDGWRTVTDNEDVFRRIEEKLSESGRELRMRIPMLYVEAIR